MPLVNSDLSVFNPLKTTAGKHINHLNLPDGIYVFFDQFSVVDLVKTNVDATDFFFPNGAFSDRGFELHSLITDSRKEGDSAAYLMPAGERPRSETEGKRELDIVGNLLSNIPKLPTDYVARPLLEFELAKEIRNDRHAVITLVGRGGIGKTSLALKVLHTIAEDADQFEFIFWFSARDIDLLQGGPKIVRPGILTEFDIADQFAELVGPPQPPPGEKKPKLISYLASCMSTTQLGGKSIFVFDNFETARSPVDLFVWIDTNIRLPNKVLITSRFREFRADFPIEIGGMERSEADKLIDQTAQRLGISEILTTEYRDRIFDESDGHPYVIKIILGEVADTKSTGRPQRIMARSEDILDALFERTYANLSPAGRRVFLTLCAWRSYVPQLALEAILLRPDNDRMDVGNAVDELIRMSLVERSKATDGNDFLSVPLVAAIFGNRKLSANANKASIEADVRMLQDIGPTSETKLKEGIAPRILNLFESMAARIEEKKATIEDVQPVLEFVSRSYPTGWLLMADMYEEHGGLDGLSGAAESVRRYLESQPDAEAASRAWERLARMYIRLRDIPSAADAFVRAAEFSTTPFSSISNTANWLNNHRIELIEHAADERERLLQRFVRAMERRVQEASATDLSRLAWLYLPRETGRALELSREGLSIEPGNIHCIKLVERLTANAY